MRRHYFWDAEAIGSDGRPGDWVEYVPQRRVSKGPAIISDSLDGVWNPVDGRRYDSKSRYYKAVRDAGCEIAGNDSSVSEPKPRQLVTPGNVGQDIARAYDQLA